jgi:hypothetical protein
MNAKTFFSAAVVAGSMLCGVAHAATLITINSAGNGVDTSATAKVFNAIGASGIVNSQFLIAAATGTGVGFTETGTFQLENFTVAAGPGNPFGTVSSNVNVGYSVFADINFIGTGTWNANEFSADTGLFSLGLRAVNLTNNSTINLGTATLSPGADSAATVTLVTAAPSGRAITSISGTFDFTPAPGTTGPGNFFVAPVPFNIGFSVGNFGGNSQNTTYTVNGDGSISVFTPGPGLNPATGNLTFVSAVPEPGALALVGIALAGLGFASRRKLAAKA